MRNSFLCLFVFAVANMGAQNNMADILASIETNNPELKAGAQIVLSQKAEVSSQNSLEDPRFEFGHLWGADNTKDRKYDISVSQSFDFPSLYVQRYEIGNLKRTLYDGQQAVLRQQILLQAKELCLQVIYLNRSIRLGNERQAAADELVKLYRERLTSGDANILDVNKIEIEQLNSTTSNIQRRNELAACLAQLQALNGGEPLNLAESALTEYSDRELPASFDDLKEQALQSDPELQMLRQENQIAGAGGILMTVTFPPRDNVIFAKEGFMIVALAWLLLSAIGALPFVISKEIPSFCDAFFNLLQTFLCENFQEFL